MDENPQNVTNITVNKASAEAPKLPTVAAQKVTTETVDKKQVNWGGVAKGVAIVAAVVVVGVVAAWGITALAGGTFLGGLLGAGASGAAGTVGALQGTGSMLAATGEGLLSGLGLLAPATVAAPGAATVATHAIATAGGVAAAGAAATVAVPTLMKTNLVDHAAQQVTTHTPVLTPDAGGHGQAVSHDATNGAMLGAKKNALVNSMDLPDLPDEHLQESSSHHAAEKHQEHRAERTERSSRAILARSKSASQNWADRVGKSEPKTPVEPRQSSFSAELDSETARLNDALGSPSAVRG